MKIIHRHIRRNQPVVADQPNNDRAVIWGIPSFDIYLC